MLRLDSFLPISIRRNHRRHRRHPSRGNDDNLPGRRGNQQTNFHVLSTPPPSPLLSTLAAAAAAATCQRLSFNLLQFSLLVICSRTSLMLEYLMTLCVQIRIGIRRFFSFSLLLFYDLHEMQSDFKSRGDFARSDARDFHCFLLINIYEQARLAEIYNVDRWLTS